MLIELTHYPNKAWYAKEKHRTTKLIRQLSRPSTAHCTLGHYIGMLISEPKHPTCRRLAESIDIGHDSINNFLGRERTKIFKENKIRKILITSIMILLVSIIQAGCMYKLEKKDPYEKGEIITWKLWENMIIKTELGERRIHSSANHTERGEKEFYHPEQEHYLGQFPIDYQPKPFPKLSKEESSVIPFTPILAGKALEFNLMLNGSWVQATDRDVIAQDALDHPDQVKVIINPTNNKWNTKQFFEEQLISDLDISSAKTTNDVTCYKFKGEKGNYTKPINYSIIDTWIN